MWFLSDFFVSNGKLSHPFVTFEDYRHMKEKKPSPMNDYRIQQLEKIGFEWRILPINNKVSAWNVKFEELVAFKKMFGHCDVPQVR